MKQIYLSSLCSNTDGVLHLDMPQPTSSAMNAALHCTQIAHCTPVSPPCTAEETLRAQLNASSYPSALQIECSARDSTDSLIRARHAALMECGSSTSSSSSMSLPAGQFDLSAAAGPTTSSPSKSRTMRMKKSPLQVGLLPSVLCAMCHLHAQGRVGNSYTR